MIALSEVTTVERLKAYNTAQGYYFFSPDTLRYFDSRIAPDIINTPTGIIFITSEKFNDNTPRLYTVRIMHEDGSVSDVNCKFQQFPSLTAARKHARTEAAKLQEAK